MPNGDIGSVSEAVSSQERLSIRYDGPALEESSMDVRELAPSLLAICNNPPTAQVVAPQGRRPTRTVCKHCAERAQ
jgi:hypothetical protein